MEIRSGTNMKSEIKWGIRKKGTLFIVLLLLLSSAVTLGFGDMLHHSVGEEVSSSMEKVLTEQMLNSSIALNTNATLCMENYMHSIELSADAASKDIPSHIGMHYSGGRFLWTSRYLLTQVNSSLVDGIMKGNISNHYYDEMLAVSGNPEMVDSALYYLVHTPSLNYSELYINRSAYNAINSLGEALFNNGSRSLYDFLYSVMLPQYREQLDELMPVADMLYSFRNINDLLWSYYTDENSGFTVLIPSGTYLSPLFNPFVRSWYVKARDSGHEVWSSVYLDELTGCPVATSSAPVMKNGSFAGVVGFDILLTTISQKTRSFYISNTSFAFLMTSDGIALAAPSNSTLGKDLSQGDEPFNRSVREILNGSTGTVETILNGRNVTLVYSTMRCTGWKFVSVVDMEEVKEKVDTASNSSAESASRSVIYLAVVQLSIAVVLFFISFIIIDGYTRRIERLTRYADEVSRGNFDVKGIEVDSSDELGELQKAFGRMVNSFRVAMRELERGKK